MLSEEIFHFIRLNELLFEHIGSSFRRLVHADAFYHTLSTGLGLLSLP